jgi:hypothetical protein
VALRVVVSLRAAGFALPLIRPIADCIRDAKEVQDPRSDARALAVVLNVRAVAAHLTAETSPPNRGPRKLRTWPNTAEVARMSRTTPKPSAVAVVVPLQPFVKEVRNALAAPKRPQAKRTPSLRPRRYW